MGLSDIENKVFELITNNDLNGLKAHLSINQIEINILDEHGMTPLTHACFKGNYEISQYLLDQGADVNTWEHEHKYSALHFAALSGNAKLCQLLLDAGAKSHRVNSVGRTAPQMAAFVGNHQCVATINNYIPKSEIDYYTVVHGRIETQPKLHSSLSSALHKLIMQVNIHPVRVALNMLPSLSDDAISVKFVLELMSQKEMTRGSETNEIMSFKLHYLSCIIGEIIKNKPTEQGGKFINSVEVFVRRILKPGSGEKYMDAMVIESVRAFPYRESTLFRQMVSSLASDSPSPLSVVITAINGQRSFSDDIKCCATCKEETATKKCSKCRQVQYCDRECQRLHWFVHKKECSRSVGVVEDENAITSRINSMKVDQD